MWWESRCMSYALNLLFCVMNVGVKNTFLTLEDGTNWLSRNDAKEF